MTSGTPPEANARTPVRCLRRERAERDNIFKAGGRRARQPLRLFRFSLRFRFTRVLHSWFMNRQKCIGYLVRGQGMFYKMGNALLRIEKPERADARTAERRTHATSVSSSVNVTTDSASE